MSDFISDTIQLHIAAFSEGEYKFLLLKRADNLPVYPSIWQTITGKTEPGETSLQAALRELREETGLKPIRLWTVPYLATFFDTANDCVNASPVFGVLVEEIMGVIISEEHQECEWLDFKRAEERLLLPSHREGMRIFRDYILLSDTQNRFEIKFVV